MTERLLNITSVEEHVGLKKTKIYELIKTKEFPASKMVRGRSVWLLSDIQEWIANEWQAAS